MHEDEVGPSWTIDTETRAALRVERIRAAYESGDVAGAVIEAEELLEEEPDHPDGLFLLAEAMLEANDAEGAVQAYEHYLATNDPRPEILSGLAIARFDHCDLRGAVEAAREAARMQPDNAEAHYYLGLALERLPGRQAEAVTSFASARQLDPDAYPFPAELTDDEWEEAVHAAMLRLPPDIQVFWSGIPIRLQDLPVIEELRDSDPPITPTVSGLYEGKPPEDDASRARPTSLRLFRRNLARMGSFDGVVEQIAQTLEHEALDWLGLEAAEP